MFLAVLLQCLTHSYCKTEGGCSTLVDMVLLRQVSTMQSEVVQVNILQEFPVPKTTFEDGLEGTGSSFSGASVLNYLLVSAPPRHSCTPAINMRTGR